VQIFVSKFVEFNVLVNMSEIEHKTYFELPATVKGLQHPGSSLTSVIQPLDI